ncbi:unnamed protein product [Phytophthora fragariaefolia]|uniref:Unnamed protein product n=1 Tax=Phytophthora fragariaefolia TaxID=1490495 RepID=A0A9W6YQG0_9STRA|nr:unnamed protein product [Phytophthora fragariaefolia]
MYPSFTSKQDRESKHQALLARIARDQRLEAMKREAYANAIWATDSEQNKLKDAAAMKSNSHSATAVGDIYEKMASSNAHLMVVEDKDAQPSSVFSSVYDPYEATGDFPMLEEKPMEEQPQSHLTQCLLTLVRSLEADDDIESKAIVDYKMEDMTQDETLQFYSWLKSRGYDPEELNDDSKKRALDDSTISLDTRVNKKCINLTMGDKDKVQYMYDNIDGLDELKLRPYVRRNRNVTQSIKAYLGPGMRIFNNSGSEMKKQTQASKQIDWSWTFNYVISEVGNGARALNHQIGRETNAEKQNLYALRLKTIYDVLRVVDPIQAQEQEDLSKLPPSSFETPDQRDKNSSNRISPAKKDFVFKPPAGKGLTGRGLRGGGVAPRRKARTYNLADIEGSGSASDLSVGPIRSMSDELTAMVKDLLYNDNISQQAYRDLSIEDQRVFYEMVRKTHVEHTLQTPIEDPRLTLKAEFDKLRGEISLGNNNPDMLRELYRLAADMFEQKILSNKEFRSIIGALV